MTNTIETLEEVYYVFYELKTDDEEPIGFYAWYDITESSTHKHIGTLNEDFSYVVEENLEELVIQVNCYVEVLDLHKQKHAVKCIVD
jgi:hypothetical protein